MMHSENINELTTALAKAQAEIRPAVEDKKNPHFKSSYSSLNSIWAACRAPLSKNGLAIMQIAEQIGENLSLITLLSHTSGQWVKSILPISSAKEKPQTMGSSLTYARRYALAAIVGISFGEDTDDDANLAQEKTVEILPLTMEMLDWMKNNPQRYEYIRFSCDESKQPESNLISRAMNNPKGFDIAFEKWLNT